MNEKINIFGVELDAITAKAAMKEIMQYLEGETISTVEIVTLEMLMQGQDNLAWKEWTGSIDLLLPGEREIFEAAKSDDARLFRDLEGQVFWKMLLRYLQRNKKKVFFLAEEEETLHLLKQAVRPYERGMIIAGETVLSAESGLEEAVINVINGVEPDCVFSVLPSPYQEEFIANSRALLNARLWLGCRTRILSSVEIEKKSDRLKRFFMKKIFRYQVGKDKNRQISDEKNVL